MTRMNWAKARRLDRARRPVIPAKVSERHPNRPLPTYQPPDPTWPRTVTRGPLTDGCLPVFIFQTPEEARTAGFGWIV